jgi:outer membrane protein TolC
MFGVLQNPAQRRRQMAALRAWSRDFLLRLTAVATLVSGVVGCRSNVNLAETVGNDTTWVDRVVAEVDAGAPPESIDEPLIRPVTLRTIEEEGVPEYWDISLDQVIAQAMSNSDVLRDLGGTLLATPQTIITRYTRGIVQTDPRFGMEAALSQFDAQLNLLGTFQDNERVYNNRFLGGGANFFIQDRHDYIGELTKKSATGATFALRNVTDYDANNAPGNVFSQAWQTQWEGEIRQPLMQGGGLTYNRIAGPNGTIGAPNGVLIAKVNQDITSAEFELALRNYLSDVINAYWDLYFAYRDLDAKQLALDRSRETWQAYEAEKAADRKGGVAEALAREQFYRFETDLQDAIAGRVGQRTQNKNGVTGGAFRGVNGVQIAERRLRLLIGMPVNDSRILRPAEDPELAPVVFNWEAMAGEAIYRRPELQKQRLLVKRREMELIAAKNFLAPRLDMVAKYRLRGLGHDLAGDQSRAGLRSAYGEVLTGEYDEYEVGVQMNVPLGFRQAHAAVQNAEMQLARDRAVLKEQQRQVLHDLSDMVAEVDRAWMNTQSNLNRYLAAKDAVDALAANQEVGLPVSLEQVLDAQRRLTEAQSQYYLSRTEYAIAVKNVYLERGALFEYGNVMIAGVPTFSPEPEVVPAEAPPAFIEAPAEELDTDGGEASVPELTNGRATVSLVEPETLATTPLLPVETALIEETPVAPVLPPPTPRPVPSLPNGLDSSLAPYQLLDNPSPAATSEGTIEADSLFAPVPLPDREKLPESVHSVPSASTLTDPEPIQQASFDGGLFESPISSGLLD